MTLRSCYCKDMTKTWYITFASCVAFLVNMTYLRALVHQKDPWYGLLAAGIATGWACYQWAKYIHFYSIWRFDKSND